jgi:Ca2+-binding EF-hand superfamily protein
MIRLSVVASVYCALLIQSRAQAADAPPDVLDLLILRPTATPLRLRLHVNVEELPFRHHWKNGAMELFRKVDRNKDGKLDDSEKAGLPWPSPKGELSEAAYLDLALANSPPVEVVHAPINPRSASGLFLLLDRNGDGVLDAEELKAAPKLLDTRDFDDDGVLSYDELIPPYKPGEPRGAVIAALTPQGTLNADDLQKFGKRLGESATTMPPAAVDVWIPLGRTRLRIDAQGKDDVKVRKGSENVFVDAGDVKVDVIRARPDPMRPASTFPSFNSLDKDNNAYLDATELKAIFADQTGAIFSLIDADEEGRVSREEYHRYILLRDQIRKASIFVQSTDLGQEMFAAVDGDRDGRLTRFELSKAVDLLSTMGSDGRIGGKNFPVTVEVIVGGAASSSRMNTGMRERPKPSSLASASKEESEKAPTWFHEMDRNRDGAVDRTEFLGPKEQFKKLDGDQDGLVIPAEARAAFPSAPHTAKPADPPKTQRPQKRPSSKN